MTIIKQWLNGAMFLVVCASVVAAAVGLMWASFTFHFFGYAVVVVAVLVLPYLAGRGM